MQFQAGNISVDEHFARFGSKSYAINKITSVDVRETPPNNTGWVLIGVLAGIMAFAGFGHMVDDDPTTSPFNLLLAAAIAGGVAWLLWRARRSTYRLMLATAGGEVQAMQTHDRDVIAQLRTALEQQIALH